MKSIAEKIYRCNKCRRTGKGYERAKDPVYSWRFTCPNCGERSWAGSTASYTATCDAPGHILVSITGFEHGMNVETAKMLALNIMDAIKQGEASGI